MKIIGVTGSIGSGKSYVASQLSRLLEIPIIDSDKVYHDLIDTHSPLCDQLSAEFGPNVLNEDGSVNRKALAAIVFSDRKKLQKLNEITHPQVDKSMQNLLKKYNNEQYRAVIIEVPLMFESGFDKKCDVVIAVVADKTARIDRICSRDGCSSEYALQKINNQKDDEFYIEKSTFTVENNSSEGVSEQILQLSKKLLCQEF